MRLTQTKSSTSSILSKLNLDDDYDSSAVAILKQSKSERDFNNICLRDQKRKVETATVLLYTQSLLNMEKLQSTWYN